MQKKKREREDMTISSVYAPDNKDSNHIKQKWTKPRGEIHKSNIGFPCNKVFSAPLKTSVS